MWKQLASLHLALATRASLLITRDAFIQALKQAQIGTSVHFIPLHLHPFYRDTYHLAIDGFPAALHAYQRQSRCPCTPGMTVEDIEDVNCSG